MTLPTNNDFANCELSIEELEAIAAGGFWSTLKHVVSTVAHDVFIGSVVAVAAAGVTLGIGNAFYTPKRPPLQ